MHFTRGLQQQIDQRRMQVGPRNQFDRRGDQVDIARRNVLPKINDSPRKLELVQVMDAARITVGLGEIEKLDVRCPQKLAHGLCRGGIAHHEYGVNSAGQ